MYVTTLPTGGSDMRHPRRTRLTTRRRRRGQTTVESVLVMSVLFIIFAMVIYLCYLGIARMVGYHASFVTTRSYVVGFHDDIVERAKEVGSMGMAGPPETPDDIVGLDPIALGSREPTLIRDFLTEDGYTLYYTHWHNTYADLPTLETDGTVSIRVWTRDYHMGDDDHPMPLNLHKLRTDINRENYVRMYNHAAFYLE